MLASPITVSQTSASNRYSKAGLQNVTAKEVSTTLFLKISRYRNSKSIVKTGTMFRIWEKILYTLDASSEYYSIWSKGITSSEVNGREYSIYHRVTEDCWYWGWFILYCTWQLASSMIHSYGIIPKWKIWMALCYKSRRKLRTKFFE